MSLSAGIEACKVVEKLEGRYHCFFIQSYNLSKGDICQYNGHDIALVRLSRPMPGMRSLRLNFENIRTGKATIMAGTGQKVK